jgi:hypothetical protein
MQHSVIIVNAKELDNSRRMPVARSPGIRGDALTRNYGATLGLPRSRNPVKKRRVIFS